MAKLRIALAATLIVIILLLPPATDYGSYIDILSHTSMTLKGQAPYSDVAQDFYGFTALMTNKDPYVLLGPALKTMGIQWKASFSSTHPPTAFLLVAPVAFLPWPISSMAWAWLMLICLCLSFRIGLGYSWDVSLLITAVALFWPPIATSFDQITIVWLFGLAMAYKYRNEHPFVSGLFIGIASFTKLMPSVVLFPFLIRHKWEAVKGFALSWLTAFGILVLLSPKTLIRYFITNRTNAIDIIMRADNSSFLFFLNRRVGLLGLILTIAALALLLILAFKKYRQELGKEISKEEWNIYAFMAVLLMPITWIFSIAPLLPNLFLLLEDKRPIIRVVTICAIVPPIIFPPWGQKSTLGLFGFFILSGVALVLAQSSITLSNRLSNAPNK